MAVAAIAALSGFIGAQMMGSSNRSSGQSTPVMSADQQNSTGNSNSAAKKYLLSQNPTAGYGNNSMNTAKSFLLSY